MTERAHILIVDDDPAVLDALPRAINLRLNDVAIDTAPSAAAALAQAQERDYDAILSDIKMPGMDGVELMTRLKEIKRQTPTLLMTGHADRNLGIAALQAGAYAFIQKPFDRDFLIAWLQRAIQLRQLSKTVEDQNEALRRHAVELERLVEQRTAALLQSEQRLRYALEVTVDGVWDWDIATGKVFYSRRWIESLGYSPEEVAPHVSFWESLVHPDDMPRVRETLKRHFEGDTDLYAVENRLRLKDGTYRWNLDRGRVVERDGQGRPLRMVGTDSDITTRKQAEAMLRHLAAIVESSDDAIVSQTLDGIVTSWNRAAERLFGYTAEEMIGQPISRIIPPEWAAEEPDIHKALQLGQKVDHYETIRQTKDGGPVDVSLTISPLNDDVGQLIGVSMIARDITERRL